MRLPLDLHERLVKSAERSGRSLNGETVMRLRSSLDREARV
jgi:predicted HicB family RNase H-like nuclease